MAHEKDGVDVGSFVSGYLNKDDTEQKIREVITETLTESNPLTRDDFENALPSRSHRFIRHAVKNLNDEGLIEETSQNGITVYVPGPNF